MKYMWSKNRIAKYLLPIILKDRKTNQWYVEPFVWGANMIDKVEWNRIGADINEYLIAFLQQLSYWNFEFNKFYTKEEYNNIRYNKEKYSKAEVWYVWINCSYGWSWFESYAWKSKTQKWERNYQEEAIKNIKKQIEWLKWLCCIHSNYQELYNEIPPNSIIYCDPPYKWVREYNFDKWFNHEEFYDWCRKMKKQWHTIFISEYNMPDDFKCIWEMEIKSSLSANWKSWWSKKSIERLFAL